MNFQKCKNLPLTVSDYKTSLSMKDVSKVYILRDKETVIDVEISEFISLNEEKLTYKVEIKE